MNHRTQKPVQLVKKIETAKWLARNVLSGEQFKAAFMVIFQFHNSKTGALFPSYTQIAAAANVSKSTAIRTIKVLEAHGVLLVDRTDGGRNQRNNYVLQTVPPEDPIEANSSTDGPPEVSPTDPRSVNSEPAAGVIGGPAYISEGNQGTDQRSDQGRPAPSKKAHFAKMPAGAKGTRLSNTWNPSQRDVGFAHELGMPEPMIQREAMKFKNYYLSVPGARANKRDWHLAWNNWCIKAIEFKASNQKAFANSSSAMTDALQRRKFS
jgi:DNA-binding MarR family transcriptional regulator